MEKIVNSLAEIASGRISKAKLLIATFSVALIFTEFYWTVQSITDPLGFWFWLYGSFLAIAFFPYGLVTAWGLDNMMRELFGLSGGGEIPPGLFPVTIVGWLIYVLLGRLFLTTKNRPISVAVYIIIFFMLISNVAGCTILEK